MSTIDSFLLVSFSMQSTKCSLPTQRIKKWVKGNTKKCFAGRSQHDFNCGCLVHPENWFFSSVSNQWTSASFIDYRLHSEVAFTWKAWDLILERPHLLLTFPFPNWPSGNQRASVLTFFRSQSPTRTLWSLVPLSLIRQDIKLHSVWVSKYTKEP